MHSYVSIGCHGYPQGALSTLKAEQCTNLTSVTLQLPASCPLTDVSLAECSALTALHLSVVQLRRLNVNACKSLTHVDVSCAELRSVAHDAA